MDKALLRVGEAADLLSVSRWTIYRWLEEGRLEGTKIGKGSMRVFSRSISDLVEQNRTENLTTGSIVSSGSMRSNRKQVSVDRQSRPV